MSARPEVMILLSGGVDSTACIHFFLEVGRPLVGLFVDYGQVSASHEFSAATSVAEHYGLPLLSKQWHGAERKQPGLVPARNGFLLTAALMERPASVTQVVLGIHAGSGYPDCDPSFLECMQKVYDLYAGGAVAVVAPFLEWNKGEVYAYAVSNGIPLNLTYSCEAGTEKPCGVCRSCLDRGILNDWQVNAVHP